MPFKEIYSVNFANGNLDPHVNLLSWPPMQFSPSTPDDLAAASADSQGLTLSVIRRTNTPGFSANDVFLVPPPIPVDTRLRMRLGFDLPRAGDVPPAGNAPIGGGEPIARFSQSDYEAAAGGAELPGDLSQSALIASAPPAVSEKWGVSLTVSPSPSFKLPFAEMANATCGFERAIDGVRLKTPGNLQRDDPALLETPLDYDRYEGIPASSFRPTLFTLEHTFCGIHMSKDKGPIGHTVGSGFLRIDHLTPLGVLRDRRDYSSEALVPPPQEITPTTTTFIKALGVALTTTTVGLVRVRLRTFSLSFNPHVPQSVFHK